MAGCVSGQAPGKLEAGGSKASERSCSPWTWCGQASSSPFGRFVEVSLGLGEKVAAEAVPSDAVTFCKSFEVKFQEPETVGKSKALEEFAVVEVLQ